MNMELIDQIISACVFGETEKLEELLDDNPTFDLADNSERILLTLLSDGFNLVEGRIERGEGDIEELKRRKIGVLNNLNLLIEKGIDINSKSTHTGESILHDAIMIFSHNRLEIEVIKKLLDAGANPNSSDKWDNTILSAITTHISEKEKAIILIKLLIEYGLNPNFFTKDCPSFMYLDDCEILKILIDAGAEVNFQNVRGDTALHFQARSFGTEIAKVLLENGANPEIKNNDGETPLDVANENEKIDLIKLLSEKSNEKDRDDPIKDSSEHTKYNSELDQSLFRSIESNNLTEVIDLLKRGANPNAKNLRNTPLSYTIFFGNGVKMAKLLIEAGADINAPVDIYDTSMLVSAASDNDFATVELLLKHGADPNAFAGRDTPLGAGLGDPRIIKLLIGAGAKVDNPQIEESLLFRAVMGNMKESAKVLIENGADSSEALKMLKEQNEARGVGLLNELGIHEDREDIKIAITELKDWKVIYYEEALKHAIERNICDDYCDPDGVVEIQWQTAPKDIFIYGTIECKNCKRKYEFEFEDRITSSCSNRAECPHCQYNSEYISWGLIEDKNFSDPRGKILIGSPKILKIHKITSESIVERKDEEVRKEAISIAKDSKIERGGISDSIHRAKKGKIQIILLIIIMATIVGIIIYNNITKRPLVDGLEDNTEVINSEDILVLLGASFEPLSNKEKSSLGIQSGLRVTSVRQGKFDKIGIREGFIIILINRKPVNSVRDIVEILNVTEDGFFIEGIDRSGSRSYYAFSLKDRTENDPF